MTAPALAGSATAHSPVAPVGGGSGGSGPNTSIALAGTQDVADGDTDAIVFDTEEADTNLVAGVPTVPADDVYWVNAAALVEGAGVDGEVTLTISASTTGTVDVDRLPPGASSTVGVLRCTRRLALVAGDELTATIANATGDVVTVGGDPAATFLQFWR